MKYQLIVECERCGEKAFFEGNTDEVNHQISTVAFNHCDIKAVSDLKQYACGKCRASYEAFQAEQKALLVSFKANQLQSIKEADWG
jgi:DNA-directed RNA polymerase subunit RPC12/RpoP